MWARLFNNNNRNCLYGIMLGFIGAALQNNSKIHNIIKTSASDSVLNTNVFFYILASLPNAFGVIGDPDLTRQPRENFSYLLGFSLGYFATSTFQYEYNQAENPSFSNRY